MKKYLLISLLFSLATLPLLAQFNMRYGSYFFDRGRKAIQTHDGKFLVVGETKSFGSAGNGFIMKVDTNGSLIWIKDYSGINADEIYDVIEVGTDLLMCGLTYSYGMGQDDGFVMETDSLGNVIWAKTYGGISNEGFLKICIAGAAGYYLAGYGGINFVILHIDLGGNVQWIRTVGNCESSGDWWNVGITSIISGGAVLCTSTYPGTYIACWRFSSAGTLMWSKQFEQNPVGSGVLGCDVMEKPNGDVLINYSLVNTTTVSQSVDNFILTLSSAGSYIADRSYGAIYIDNPRTIINTSDGGVAMLGETNSAGNGDYDACLIKLDPVGAVQWAKAYGSAWYETPATIAQTSDGGYIIAGQTFSFGTNQDSSKVYLVKTDSLGNTCNAVSWNPIMNNQSVTFSTPSVPSAITLPVTPFTWNTTNRYFATRPLCLLTGDVELVSDEGLNIYPNPSNGKFVLENNNSLSLYNDIRVFNCLGELVFESRTNQVKNEIDLHDQPKGIYFLRAITESKIITRKIIIE